ncbi:hypothetical protein BCV71DRAFT_180444, partial [Rhizopus microsporus]
IYAHLTNSSEEFCIKQTVLDYALLFMDENDNSLRMPNTEQDLLEDIYGFIKISERLSGTTMTMHDYKQSYASSEHKNKLIISNVRQKERKASSDQPDLCFHYAFHELACLEIGVVDCGSSGTKEMNE